METSSWLGSWCWMVDHSGRKVIHGLTQQRDPERYNTVLSGKLVPLVQYCHEGLEGNQPLSNYRLKLQHGTHTQHHYCGQEPVTRYIIALRRKPITVLFTKCT